MSSSFLCHSVATPARTQAYQRAEEGDLTKADSETETAPSPLSRNDRDDQMVTRCGLTKLIAA